MRALDPAHLLGAEALAEGDVVEAAGVELRVLGHAGAHGRLAVVRARSSAAAVLTGDTILGRGTTVVAHPDGNLGDYLASLRRLRRARRRDGAPRPRSRAALGWRGAPTATWRTARAAGAGRATRSGTSARTRPRAQIVEVVYADVDQALWPAAELSVRAQLAYLHERDR